MEKTENKTEKTESSNPDVIFANINPDNPITEMESLCMSCGKNGMTRILPTKIPFFKEIIIVAFTCPHCGFKNSEIEPGDELPDQGIKFTLKVSSSKDFNRQVVKSSYASINIPCCGLEIPSTTQKGKLSTVEGFITTARDSFQESIDSGYYSEMGEDFITKIKALITQLNECLEGKKSPFEFILDDPSGKSFIENPYAPQTDIGITVEYYNRTREMAEQLGFSYENQLLENERKNDGKVDDKAGEKAVESSDSKENKKPKNYVNPTYYDKQNNFTVYKSNSEVSNKIIDFTKAIDDDTPEKLRECGLSFQVDCYCCHSPGEMHTCVCEIPYFKEIIINCFKCEKCGYKTTEVKGGGGISEKGQKIKLSVECPEDLNRDLFKSDTSKIIIPEVGFECTEGSLGGVFTTVEGIIEKIISNLENNPFMSGDSASNNQEFENFLNKLRGLKNLEQKFTLILDDPCANSFIFPIGEPENDKRLVKEDYERTYEQNENLGINDMKVD